MRRGGPIYIDNIAEAKNEAWRALREQFDVHLKLVGLPYARYGHYKLELTSSVAPAMHLKLTRTDLKTFGLWLGRKLTDLTGAISAAVRNDPNATPPVRALAAGLEATAAEVVDLRDGQATEKTRVDALQGQVDTLHGKVAALQNDVLMQKRTTADLQSNQA